MQLVKEKVLDKWYHDDFYQTFRNKTANKLTCFISCSWMLVWLVLSSNWVQSTLSKKQNSVSQWKECFTRKTKKPYKLFHWGLKRVQRLRKHNQKTGCCKNVWKTFEFQKTALNLALEWDTQTLYTGFIFKLCHFHVLHIFTALEGLTGIPELGTAAICIVSLLVE